jgi:hypothetical protein
MLFDEKVEQLIRENEGVRDDRDDNLKFILDRKNVLYYMKFKFYRMPIIDLKRREVRLVETDHKGNYLYDEKGKKIKNNISRVVISMCDVPRSLTPERFYPSCL